MKQLKKNEMKLIRKKALELTKGKSGVDSRISIFNYVRDIPYYVQPNQNPADAMKENRANCGQKARLLDLLLKEIRVRSKFISMEYRLDKLPMPAMLLKTLQLKTDYHLANLVRRGNKWVLLDATADPGLAKGKFHVNEWDGKSDTRPFVKPVTTSQDKEYKKRLNSWLKQTETIDRKKLKVSLDKWNRYFDKLRKKK